MNRLSLKIAASELSAGLKGFWVYLACLTLGTAAIAAAGSLTATFSNGAAGEARTLLGADAEIVAAQRLPSLTERETASQFGTTSESVSLDAMASAGGQRAQVDVRGVDGRYPLLGAVTLSGGEETLTRALAQRGDRWGVVVSQSFLDKFGVSVGDTVEIGPIAGVITARLAKLPDRIGEPGGFGPEAMVALEALQNAGRLTPGQLFRSSLRILFRSGAEFEDVEAALTASLEDSGGRLREPADAVDGLQNLLQTLNSFLAIIGIAALVSGGAGVAQATRAFLQSRTQSIAVLKVFGADAATVRSVYLIQLGALALLGTLAGTAIGAGTPFLVAMVAGDDIPLPLALGLYPFELAKALTLGLFTAAAFALPAIGRARATRPAVLFSRLDAAQDTARPWLERGWAAGAGAGLAGLAVLSSYRPLLTALLLAGAVVTAGVFLLAAWLVKRAARIAALRAKGFWRLALSNLAGPGSIAPLIIPSLGLGLALLILVAAVQANLIRQISSTAPANAPQLIFSQIPNARVGDFNAVLVASGIDTSDPDQYREAPFLLGRVTHLRGQPVIEADVAEEERWVVRGETSLTYFAAAPPETVLVAGAWWPEDYQGPPLVSVEADAARGLGLALGDTVGFSIAGREVVARVASLRRVDWGTFGIGSNTAFIFAPGTLEAARPAYVAISRANPVAEEKIIAGLGEALPEVVVFQTRPALQAAARIFGQIAIAINAAASIVTLAGLLVLLGTVAALARARQREAALLKVFGATRDEILRLHAAETGLAAAVAALIAALIGLSAAYPVVVQVFEAEWSLPWQGAILLAAAATALAAAGGAAASLAALARSSAEVLRAP